MPNLTKVTVHDSKTNEICKAARGKRGILGKKLQLDRLLISQRQQWKPEDSGVTSSAFQEKITTPQNSTASETIFED